MFVKHSCNGNVYAFLVGFFKAYKKSNLNVKFLDLTVKLSLILFSKLNSA